MYVRCNYLKFYVSNAQLPYTVSNKCANILPSDGIKKLVQNSKCLLVAFITIEFRLDWIY